LAKTLAELEVYKKIAVEKGIKLEEKEEEQEYIEIF